MVATIDGKILSGDRSDHVVDLGSKFDHALMQRITLSADAVLIGAGTLRTTFSTWDPGTPKRIVVSNSGRLEFDTPFFKNGEAFVASAEDSLIHLPDGVSRIGAGQSELDFGLLLSRLKVMGVERLAVLGGSEMNAQLLHEDLIDELFLTIAPKVKLGRDVPTYADGESLTRESIQRYRIIEHHVVEDEVFLRYRRYREG